MTWSPVALSIVHCILVACHGEGVSSFAHLGWQQVTRVWSVGTVLFNQLKISRKVWYKMDIWLDWGNMTPVMRKQTLRSLSLSYPKKWLAGGGPTNFIVSVIPKDELAVPRPFYGYDNYRDLKVCFLVTRIIYKLQCCVPINLTSLLHILAIHWLLLSVLSTWPLRLSCHAEYTIS